MLKKASLLVTIILLHCSLNIEPVRSGSASCDWFFNGDPWPAMKRSSKSENVRLCQTVRDSKIPLYATLFDTEFRRPVYSANRVRLDPNATVNARPKNKNLWKRVASNLCGNTLPTQTIYSAIRLVYKAGTFKKCKRWQAVNDDYSNNGLNLDRGHLSPSSINSRNKQKQLATFTLTNVAPQFSEFDNKSWKTYECVTEKSILQLVPKEPVFIITGVYGAARDQNKKALWLKKRVLVPGRYWKAVCYPGNSDANKPAWGYTRYAIVQKNENEEKVPDYRNYVPLDKFAENYFEDNPFGSDCMKATFGKFGEEVLDNWNNFISTHCGYKTKKNVMDELIDRFFFYY